MTPPASATTVAAARRMAAMASGGMCSGKAEMFSASATAPPIANTSLHAFAAAMAPKSAGSSTSGGKKSVVETIATSSLTLYTAASSNGAKPTSNDRSAPPSSPANDRTSSANGDAPHFAAHPPHDVHSVSRISMAASVIAGQAMPMPQMVTVFRSRLRDDARGYEAKAEEMEAAARAIPGFVDFKSFSAADGERVSIIVFDS